MDVLDIGAGPNPVSEDADTLDRLEEFDPDILHDLTEFPLPIEDDQYDEIYLRDVLEHLPTDAAYLDQLFQELERVLRPAGSIFVRVPYYTGSAAAGDVQHSRTGYSYQFHLDYVDTSLEVVERRIVFPKRKLLFWNWLAEGLANKYPFFWEHTCLAGLFPATNLEIEVRYG